MHLANEEPIPSRLIIRAERDNVTLKCRADANPSVDSSSFGWYKNVSNESFQSFFLHACRSECIYNYQMQFHRMIAKEIEYSHISYETVFFFFLNIRLL